MGQDNLVLTLELLELTVHEDTAPLLNKLLAPITISGGGGDHCLLAPVKC